MEEIERLYREGRGKYVRIINKVLNNNHTLSEDVVQEAFMKAHMYFHTYDANKSSLGSWFTRILFREMSKVLKKENKHSHVNMDRIRDQIEAVDYCKMVEDQLSVDGVLEDNFKFKDCLIILLIYYRGYKIAEVASTLEVSESKVKKVCFNFRNIIRKQ